jgi:hypothetical protein
MALTQISTQGIKDGTITNADLNASAAIARTKLANVDLVDDTSPQLGGNLDTNGNLVIFPDSNGTTNRLLFGTNKFQMYYNSGNSRMQIDNITGDFTIRNLASGGDIDIIAGDDIRIRPQGGENGINLVGNGAVELYYDNSKKFETTSYGVLSTEAVKINGNFIELNNSADSQYALNRGTTQLFSIRNNALAGVHINTQNSALLCLGVSTGTNNGSVESTLSINSSGNVGIDNQLASEKLHLADNKKLALGDSADLKIDHDGSHSNIHNVGTGNFHIRGNGTDQIKIQAKSGEQSIVCNSDGAVELYFDNSKKFETTSTGVALTGNLELAGAGGNVSTNWDNAAWEKVIFDASYNTNPQGPNKIVLQNDTSWKAGFGISSNEVGMYSGGNIVLYSKTTDSTASTKETLAKFIADGAVELYWNNSLRASTDNQGLLLPSGKGVAFGDVGCKVSGVPGGGGSAGISFMVNSAGSWKIDGNGVFLNNNRNESPSSLNGAIHLQPSTSGGNTGIFFNSKTNANSDAAYIWWYDDNDNYRINNGTENGALVIGIQNDGNAISEDAVAIESSGNIFLNPGNDGGLVNAGGVTGPDFSEGKVYIGRAASKYEVFHGGSHSLPDADNTYDLGSSSKRFRFVYTTDLQLSNENTGGNEVDGTWGNYTIQEGADDLFLINRRSGKRYKFNLTEVS